MKPFIFLLELIKRHEWLTQEEMSIPVLYGHNPHCLDYCSEKIIALRNGKPLTELINNPKTDLDTSKTNDRTIEQKLVGIDNIANTFKNYLESTLLIYKSENGYRIEEKFNGLIESKIEKRNDFIKYDTDFAFQRRYGSWNKSKDTRRLESSKEKYTDEILELSVRSFYYEYAANSLITGRPIDFIAKMNSEFGIDRRIVEKAIQPLIEKSLDIYETTYLAHSRNGARNSLDFERNTAELLNKRLNYNSYHTGQENRKGARGGYSDIFIVDIDGDNCGIIDCKASPEYNINANDHRAMVKSYIPAYKELAKKYCRKQDPRLLFVTYVAGGLKKGIEQNLEIIKKESGVETSAISSMNLLDLCKSEKANDQIAVNLFFSQTKVLQIEDF